MVTSKPHHPITHLLYLHGFRSSPQSAKARVLAHYLATQHPALTWWCPQLPPSPRAACQLLAQGSADWPRDAMAVMGSSLGGFYATWLAELTGCQAVLLNPAVNPARDLETYIGEQSCWQDPGERFYFKPEYVQELRDLSCAALTRLERYLAVIAKGDELLDWREAYAHYAGADMRLLDGGDHALSNFEQHIPGLLAFLGLASPDAGNPV